MLFTIVIFIIVLGLLVFVHELGHFLVAKRSGMKVDEFGFGFPPRLIGIQKIGRGFKTIIGNKEPADSSHTVYSINTIPLGGFVKIVGENNEDAHNPQSFINKPFFPRLLTLLAGVLMNIVAAWVLISIGYMVGLPVATDGTSEAVRGGILSNQQALISDVESGSPAERAGIMPGDIVIAINDEPQNSIGAVQQYIKARQGETFHFDLLRINTPIETDVVSRANPEQNQGPTGIALLEAATLRYPWYRAPFEGAKTTVYQLRNIVVGLGQLFTSGDGFKSLGGPVKIAQLTGQVASLGAVRLMQFAAFLSLNLAVLNALPFPALDGGRVMFLLIEKIRGKRNNQTVEQIANAAGFIALLLLMLIVTVKDISDLGGFFSIFHKLIGS